MSLQNDKVSILIPVYNREDLIEETVASAVNQTYSNLEVIIVDNQSTDNTWSILNQLAKRDRRVKIFQNETNIGPVRNWKRCVDEASGVYGKILWSDDLIAPEFLEKSVSLFEDKDVGFVFTGTEIFIDGTDQKSSHYFLGKTGLYTSEDYINEVLFGTNYPVSPGCALFKLDDLRSNLLVNVPNKVNSDFSMHAIGNDLLIFLLTANQYKKFGFVNEKLSFFRAHEGSISLQSHEGKLPLHYALASSYFVENFRTDLIIKQNVILWSLLRKYSGSSKQFNMQKVSDFYMTNKKYNLDTIMLLKKLINNILFRLKWN